MIARETGDLHRARKLLLDPIARFLSMAFVLSGGQVAKQLQRPAHCRFGSYSIDDLQNLLFQVGRNLVERYIRPKVVAEPKHRAIEIEEVAGNYQFETLRASPSRFVCHVGNEAAVGFRIKIAVKDDLLAIPADYVGGFFFEVQVRDDSNHAGM